MTFPYQFSLADGTNAVADLVTTNDRTCYMIKLVSGKGESDNFNYFRPSTQDELEDTLDEKPLRQSVVDYLEEKLSLDK